MLKFYNDAKLKAGVFFREWKEKRAEKKETEPAGVTIPLSLVRSAKLAAWMAYFSLVYFLWLYTLDIARDRAASLHLTHVGSWIGEIQFYFPYIVGFAIVAIGIPYVAKITIPTFMSLSWRGNFWPKLWALFIAVAVSLVVIAGTFTVQGDTILERDRDSAVAVEQVQIAAATLAAQIGDVQHAMDERTQSPSAYVRTAASMSPEAYDRFVAARQGDPQYRRLLSYRAVSEEMVALNQRMSALRAQQAQSTAVASVQGVVTTERTSWIANTLGWLEGARAMLLSFVMDIVCLIMPWIALRLEQARNRQMQTGRDLHPSMLLEDHVGEASYTDMGPGDAARAIFAEGGTREQAEAAAREAAKVQTKRRKYEDLAGEDITDYVEKNGKMVKMPRRDPRTGKFRATVEVPAGDPGPEDKGFQDSARSGVTLGGVMELPAEERVDNTNANAGDESRAESERRDDHEPEAPIADAINPVEQPDLQSDEEAALALQELELTATEQTEAPAIVMSEGVADGQEDDASPQQHDDAFSAEEPIDHHQTSEREEPETRESHMLPNVAAE